MNTVGSRDQLVAAAEPEESNGRLAPRADRGRLLENLLCALSADLQVNELLHKIVQIVTEHLGANGGFLFVMDHDANQLVMRSASAGPQQGHIGILRLNPGEGLTGWSILTRETGVIDSDPLQDTRFKHSPGLGEEQFKSVLAVPIFLAGGEIVGAFTLYSVHSSFFGEERVKLAEEVSRILSGIIERAQLAAEDRRKANVLAFLGDLAKTLLRETPVEEIFKEVAAKTCGILDASLCLIALLDEEHKLVVQMKSSDAPTESVDQEFLQTVEETYHRELLEDGSILDGELAVEQAWKEVARSRPVMYDEVASGPLNAGVQQIGFINCYRNKPFSREDRSLLSTIAAQVALALKFALTMENLREVNPVWRLHRMLANRNWDTEAAALAMTLGANLEKPHVIVRARVTKALNSVDFSRSDADIAMREVETIFKTYCPGSLIHTDHGELTGLIRVRGEASIRKLARQLDASCSNVTKRGKLVQTVGMSALTTELKRYPAAYEEALESLSVGGSNLGHGHAYTYERVAPYIYVHRIASDPRARSDPLRAKFLPLAEYDTAKCTQLLRTLRLYLECRGNSSETCRILRIHRNTLRQRLARIETISGIDLEEKENWFAFFLGVRLTELLGRSVDRDLER